MEIPTYLPSPLRKISELLRGARKLTSVRSKCKAEQNISQNVKNELGPPLGDRGCGVIFAS